jgi:hypothetical protein
MSKAIARIRRDQRGMTTAEYAVGTVAACGFGGVLYKLLTSEPVMNMLKGLLEKAFGLLG